MCGYYGPDFCAISYDGITLERIEQLDERYFWASEIKLLDNQAAVYLYGGTPNYNIPQIYYIDLDTYEVGTEINISGKPWKGAYIKFINEQEKNYNPFNDLPIEEYKLVDVNGDDIPELYINFGSTAGGDMICTYYGGIVEYQYLWNYGFSYIEGQNLFKDSGGHMDVYYDNIYSIVNGEFVKRYSGEYGAPDNSNVEFDANGDPIYEYYWNGVQVFSEEEYLRRLGDVYDEAKDTNPYDKAIYDSDLYRYVGNGLCDYQEIIEAIFNY